MSSRIADAPNLPRPAIPGVRNGATLGRVCDVDGDGVVWVDFPDNALGPLPARRIGVLDEAALWAAQQSRAPVVLVFEDGDASRPLILSVPAAPAEPRPEPAAREAFAPPAGAPELCIDGRRVILRGSERIELRCGEASIVLSADGTLKIRGRDIASLARRRHRIKGGTVAIN